MSLPGGWGTRDSAEQRRGVATVVGIVLVVLLLWAGIVGLAFVIAQLLGF
jgi:hypothetical protein